MIISKHVGCQVEADPSYFLSLNMHTAYSQTTFRNCLIEGIMASTILTWNWWVPQETTKTCLLRLRMECTCSWANSAAEAALKQEIKCYECKLPIKLPCKFELSGEQQCSVGKKKKSTFQTQFCPDRKIIPRKAHDKYNQAWQQLHAVSKFRSGMHLVI